MIEEIDPNKKVIKILIGIIIILVIFLIYVIFTRDKVPTSSNTYSYNQSLVNNENKKTEIKISNDEIQVLPTALDEIYNNSTWCGTFQLIWNDLLDELVLDGKIENSGIETIENLNHRSFTTNDLSDEDYYIKYGLKTRKLKTEIENDIKRKFNETSDILDTLEWGTDSLNDPKDNVFSKYLFYSMLKKEFKFEQEFTILENDNFGSTENVKFFGINDETEESVRSQVKVLYYNSENNYAVMLKTEQTDQVILVKNSQGSTFEEIYENINKEKQNFNGTKSFENQDTLKVPNLNFDIFKMYTELIGIQFQTNKNIIGIIQDAAQTIEFKLDNTGGEIKSEAAIGTDSITVEKGRNFNFDSEFTIFLKEDEKDKPYFAANISNITLFQK